MRSGRTCAAGPARRRPAAHPAGQPRRPAVCRPSACPRWSSFVVLCALDWHLRFLPCGAAGTRPRGFAFCAVEALSSMAVVAAPGRRAVQRTLRRNVAVVTSDSAQADSPDGPTPAIPAIPASAGALIFDRAGLLLILKPTYKSGWTIPGGVMEADGETPWEACQREVREECGIDVR